MFKFFLVLTVIFFVVGLIGIIKGERIATVAGLVLSTIGILITLFNVSSLPDKEVQHSPPPLTTNSVSTYQPTSTPEVINTPQPAPKPGEDDIGDFPYGVIYPKSTSWLDDYEVKYVKSEKGVRIYLRYGPSADYDYFDYVYEAAEITALARENGFTLVEISDGYVG